MGQNTNIEWTDATWNPVRGCSRVSEGCRNCYAERVAARFSEPGMAYAGLAEFKVIGGNREAHWTGKVQLVEAALDQPLRWRRGRKIFVNSMSDLFHESLAFEDIAAIFAIMALAPRHTFQVLTKRPQRAVEFFAWCLSGDLKDARATWTLALARRMRQNVPANFSDLAASVGTDFVKYPLPNVWLGVSVEDQKTADARIPLLLQTPAAVRFISYEPALGPVDLHAIPVGDVLHGPCGDDCCPEDYPTLDWVICGGESGPGARPMHPDWARTVRDQCAGDGVPFFFKQWGEWAPVMQTNIEVGPRGCSREENKHRFDNAVVQRFGKKLTGALLDGVAHREFPAEVRA